jgi:hypothetical protein
MNFLFMIGLRPRILVNGENHQDWTKVRGTYQYQVDEALGGLAKSSNLSDVASATTSLGNLGGLAKANNLSDLASLATALANLGFLQSVSTSGYVKLPGGVVIQWGQANGASSTGTITFPLAFPNACFVALAGDIQATAASVCVIGTTVSGTTTFAYASLNGTTATAPAQFNWIALGN